MVGSYGHGSAKWCVASHNSHPTIVCETEGFRITEKTQPKYWTNQVCHQ
jgi:hypothetical protein